MIPDQLILTLPEGGRSILEPDSHLLLQGLDLMVVHFSSTLGTSDGCNHVLFILTAQVTDTQKTLNKHFSTEWSWNMLTVGIYTTIGVNKSRVHTPTEAFSTVLMPALSSQTCARKMLA